MRFALLSTILLFSLPLNAQVIKGRPTETDIERPDYLVQIKVDSKNISDWGTGSLIDPQYVLTAKHNVVVRPDKITVGFNNGDFIEATVHTRHPTLDLLLLRLDKVRYEKPIEIYPEQVKRGQTVKAVGFPGYGWETGVNAYQGEVIWAGVWFRFRGKADKGVSGGPVLVDGRLAGVEYGTYGTAIHCTNTQLIRNFLKELP